jgi:DNA-binding Lrp family transcriptional regulator
MGRGVLDSLDWEILARLHGDGREAYADIAAELEVDEDTVRRRVRDLKDAGIIRGFTVLTNPTKLGYIPVAFGLSAEAGKTDEIADVLAESRHVYKLWILSGRHSIIFHACFQDIEDFQRFIHEVLHNIEGISSFESSLATRSVVDDGSIILPVGDDASLHE